MINKTIKKSDFSYFKSIESRWGDMDGLRHVNNAKYLTYLETARLEYLSTLGIDINRWDSEVSVILAGMKVDYHRQSSYPNTYEIGCRITRLGNKSFDIFNALFEELNDDPIVTSTFTIVCYNYHLDESIAVPESIKNAYQPFKE
jgi:acyl-CoA thioester hydrolase